MNARAAVIGDFSMVRSLGLFCFELMTTRVLNSCFLNRLYGQESTGTRLGECEFPVDDREFPAV